ncbi:hypothetical protein BJX63DRAFT_413360 [Aspergillus granulosus]|uniref:Secreted protein n=1 Tax=Aspergillus granulosus TaxID=176169 RepID=A0ABR4GV50_9EURO
MSLLVSSIAGLHWYSAIHSIFHWTPEYALPTKVEKKLRREFICPSSVQKGWTAYFCPLLVKGLISARPKLRHDQWGTPCVAVGPSHKSAPG